MYRRKYKEYVMPDYTFNLYSLPIEITKKIINYKIDEIKNIKNNEDVLKLIKTFIILYKSCKLFNFTFNEELFWKKCWQNYKILNEIFISNENDMNYKDLLLLHIQEECQYCNSVLSKNKIYDGLNVRYCIECFNNRLISDYNLENYYNLNLENYNFKYYTNNIETGIENLVIRDKMFFKKDIEDNVINMTFEQLNRKLNIEFLENINFDYPLFNINYFIDKLGNIIDKTIILERSFFKYWYNIYIEEYNSIRVYNYILNKKNNYIDILDIYETDYYRKLINNYYLKLDDIDFELLYKECYFNFFIKYLKKRFNETMINNKFKYIKDIYYNNILSKTNLFCYNNPKKLLINNLKRNDKIMCYHCIRIFKTEQGLFCHNKAKHNNNDINNG